MRLLYVHIGTHKTGTTSIQWYLNQHARRLRGYGFHVPRAGRISRDLAGHHNVAWTALGDGRAQPRHGDIASLLAELEAARALRAIVSSEDLEFLADRPGDLTRFEARIRGAGWTPVYLVFLRSPGNYALSVFEELRKHGNPVQFDAFSGQVLAQGTYRSRRDHVLHMDYDLFVAKWRAAAAGELRIRSYDVAVAGRGIIAEFMSAIDAPARLGEWRQARANIGNGTVTDDMRATAQRIDTKYFDTFVRQTGVYG